MKSALNLLRNTTRHLRQTRRNINGLQVNSIESPERGDFKRQVFCNVELNGQAIEAVGFDMDFTLAQVTVVYLMLNSIYLMLSTLSCVLNASYLKLCNCSVYYQQE